jgi:hypothetical protein
MLGYVYAWNGSDWQETAHSMSPVSEALDGAIGFRLGPAPGQPAEYWLIRTDEQKLIKAWEQRGPESSPQAPAVFRRQLAQTPRWRVPEGLSLRRAPALLDGATLWFFVETSTVTSIGSRWTVEANHGRHAELVGFREESAEPLRVPLAFDLDQPHTLGVHLASRTVPGLPGKGWMRSSSEYILLGQDDVPAVWLIPKSSIYSRVKNGSDNSPSSAP